jgi:hypothetical protein
MDPASTIALGSGWKGAQKKSEEDLKILHFVLAIQGHFFYNVILVLHVIQVLH